MASKPHHDTEPDAIIRSRSEGNKQRIVLKPRAFNIVWGNDTRYWRIPPRSELTSSDNDDEAVKLVHPMYNDNEAVELVQVSWLEVTGSVRLKDSTSYQITFKLSFKRDAFGWRGSPVFLMAKVGKKGRYQWKKLKEFDSQLPKERVIDVPSSNDAFVIKVPSTEDQPDSTLYFGLYEVWSGKWKGGLKVHRAIVQET